MKSRIRTRKKSTREQTPDTTAQAKPMFESRPFVVQPQSAQKSEPTDMKKSLLQAKRYGHNLTQMKPAGGTATAVEEPKLGRGQPSNERKPGLPIISERGQGLFQTYEQARRQHDKDRAALHQAVQAGRAQNDDIRLKNSCEWISEGTVGRRLYALTPTHDSITRAKANDQERAFFPRVGGDDYMYDRGRLKPPQYYSRDKTDTTNIHWGNTGDEQDLGTQNSQGLTIIKASQQSQAQILETVKHEVQHAADKNDPDGGAIESYKTEYRAYSLEGRQAPHNQLSHTKSVKKKGYTWSERQYAIFEHIYKNYPDVKKAWDKDTTGRNFRQEVVDFRLPVSVNPQNSIRVDDFEQTLQANGIDLGNLDKLMRRSPSVIPQLRPQVEQNVQDLIAKIDALKPGEAKMILSNPAIDLDNYNLPDRFAKLIKRRLQDKARGATAPTQEDMFG